MESVKLTRECEAIQIPSGNKVTLFQGTEVVVTQALGGAYTIHVPAHGGLFRISSKDADALGKTPDEDKAVVEGDLEAAVWEQLRTCYDPEIPVNIVELGLVYGMQVTPLEDGSNRVDVKMTLTAPGCGMGASIAFDARERLLTLPGVSDVNVELVWDPPWNPEMISPEGRERLGLD